MKEKIFASILFLVIFVGAFFVGKYGIKSFFNMNRSKDGISSDQTNIRENKTNNMLQLVTSVTPTQSDWDVLPSIMKAAMINKYGKDSEYSIVKVTSIEGGYAKGTVNSAGGSGAIWFGAKANGKWRLVWDGNGVIDCKSIETYPGFPITIIPSCYDSSKGVMITR